MASSSSSNRTSSASSNRTSYRRSTMEIDYEGAKKFCRCRQNGVRFMAPRWTSWTDENPGRRFYACPNYEVHGCGYFQWHDEPVSDRVKNLLNEMKYEKRILLAENKQLKALRNGVYSFESEIDDLWMELKQLKKETLRQVESTRKKMITSYIVVCLSWIFFVVFLCL